MTIDIFKIVFYIDKRTSEVWLMFKKTPEEAEVKLLIKVSYIKDFLNLTKRKTSKKIYVNLLKELQADLQEYEKIGDQKSSELITDVRKVENLLVQKMEGLC